MAHQWLWAAKDKENPGCSLEMQTHWQESDFQPTPQHHEIQGHASSVLEKQESRSIFSSFFKVVLTFPSVPT